MEDITIGISLAIFTAFMWGASNILARVGLQSIKATSSAILSLAMSAIVAWIIALISDYEALMSVSLVGIGWFSLVGIIHFALGRLSQYQSFRYLGAARGASVTSAFPLFSIIFALVFLKEAMTIPTVIGTLCITGGIFVLLNESTDTIVTRKNRILGYAFGLATALFWGGSAVLISYSLQFAPPIVVLSFALLSGTVALSAATGKGFEIGVRTNKKAIGFLLSAGFLNGIALASFYSALALAPVVVVSPLGATSPLVTILLVHLFLKRLEHITTQILIAGLLIVLGGVLVSIY